MSPGNPNDPAIYGPVNGVFVTLSAYQAWQQQAYAAQQAAGSAAFNAEVEDTGIPAVNPYITVVTSTPPVVPGSASSSTVTAKELGLAGGNLGSYCDLFPDDPLCDVWGGGGIVVSGGSGGTTIEQPVIIEQGIAGADVNAAIDAGLSSVWAGFVGTLDGVLGLLIAGLQAALTAIGNALKAAYAVLARLSGFILQALETLTRQVIAGIVGVLNEIRELLKDLYKDVLQPIAGALGSLRQRLLDAYTRFIRPMLIWIQDVRRVLALLSVFHIKFAQKLDAKLADLEGRITKPLFFLLSLTNGLGNFLNLILRADYLFQQSTWLRSFAAYNSQTLNLQLNAMTPNVGPADLLAANQANALPSVQQSTAAGIAYIQTGGGALAPVITQASTDMDRYLVQGVS